jgi:hypothetical protein
MSAITKINSGRDEQDSYSEERKLEMRRRMQLQARGKTSLSLSSLEEVAQQQHNPIEKLSTGYRKGSTFNSFGGVLQGGESYCEELNDPDSSSFSHGASKTQNVKSLSYDPSSSQKKRISTFNKNESDLNEKSKTFATTKAVFDKEEEDKQRSLKETKLIENCSVETSFKHSQFTENSKTEANYPESVIQKMQSVLQDVQAFALKGELEKIRATRAIEDLVDTLQRAPKEKFSEEDMANLKGGIRFLNAFMAGIADDNNYRSDLISGLQKSLTDDMNLKDLVKNEKVLEENKKTDGYVIQSMDRDDSTQTALKSSTAKDLDAIYSYLDTIATASTAPTLPIMLDRFSRISRFAPEQAIKRLAISGAGQEIAALFGTEVERRFDVLSAKLDKLAKRSSQSDWIKSAIADERGRMRSALISFEEISSSRAECELAKEAKIKHFGEATLANVVAQVI